MVSVNLKDGSTLKLDLTVETDRAFFNKLGQPTSSSKDAQTTVTALWFLQDDRPALTLPIPNKFRRVFFFVEQMFDKDQIAKGDVVRIQADDVSLVVTRYYRENGKMIRVDLRHTGKQRFRPTLGG